MVAYLTNIKDFLLIAKNKGYRLEGDCCVKRLYYDLDCEVEIRINLINGVIDIKSFISFIYNGKEKFDVTNELSEEDYKYLLKDIDFLVKFNKTEKSLYNI